MTGASPETDQPGSPRHPSLPSWAHVSPARLAHIFRVAELVQDWARRMQTPVAEAARWQRAVWLHDALRDAPEDLLMRLAPDAAIPLSLRHGPASAALAAREGERDQGILDAVRYHSLGYHEWQPVGRVLYCADYLEPGRVHDREARRELASRFPRDPYGVLHTVASRRVAHLIRSGLPILEPTWRFWNGLVAPA